ncbi:MAG: hypothetical protein ACKOZU_09710, partial [Planctomycetaceae bacterium]
MHPLAKRAEQPSAAGEIATEPTGPAVGAEELVDEVAVTGLEVHHAEAGRRGGRPREPPRVRELQRDDEVGVVA